MVFLRTIFYSIFILTLPLYFFNIPTNTHSKPLTISVIEPMVVPGIAQAVDGPHRVISARVVVLNEKLNRNSLAVVVSRWLSQLHSRGETRRPILAFFGDLRV